MLVPNPYRPKMISRVSLDPAVIDCIVFWSKNPAPMLDELRKLKDYNYYFQFTLNPYGKEIECNLPVLEKRIDTFKRLADKIGKEKVIWRYDPVFINGKYTVGFHQEKFAEIAYELREHTELCMLGFVDCYRHMRDAANRFQIKPIERGEAETMAVSFRQTLNRYGVALNTCTVKVDLSGLGIPGGACVDGRLVERIVGYPIKVRKDKNQRPVCCCVESVDIGTYETCMNGCVYCYAIRGSAATVRKNRKGHDKDSPLLIGQVDEGDTIKERQMKSLRCGQMPLF